MRFGWKVLIPVALVWIVAVGCIRAISLEGTVNRNWLIGAAAVALVVFLLLGFVGEAKEEDQEPGPREFDAFAGGYPVPPMPGQDAAGLEPGSARREETISG
jgi:NADH-quinone oxidoreductase subunit H